MTSEDQPSASSDADLQRLNQARALFDKGNYKKAREIAEELRLSTSSEVKDAALGLLSDMSPPGLTRYLLALTFALLTAVTIFAYTQ